MLLERWSGAAFESQDGLGEKVNCEESRVPHWGVEEVLSWVAAAGFKEFCPVFKVAYRHLSIWENLVFLLCVLPKICWTM